MFGLFKKKSHPPEDTSLDKAINFYINELTNNPEKEDFELYESAELDEESKSYLWEVFAFMPLIAGRLMLNDLGIEYSEEYNIMNKNGKNIRRGLFKNNEVYNCCFKHYTNLKNIEVAKVIAMRGAELHAINQALNNGSNPKDLMTAPLLIPTNAV